MSESNFPRSYDTFPTLANHVSGPIDTQKHVFMARHYNKIAGCVEALERYLSLTTYATSLGGFKRVSYVYTLSATLSQVVRTMLGLNAKYPYETKVVPFEFVLTCSQTEDYTSMDMFQMDNAEGSLLYRCSTEDELNKAIGGIQMLKTNFVFPTLHMEDPSRLYHVTHHVSYDVDTVVVRGIISSIEPITKFRTSSMPRGRLNINFIGYI